MQTSRGYSSLQRVVDSKTKKQARRKEKKQKRREVSAPEVEAPAPAVATSSVAPERAPSAPTPKPSPKRRKTSPVEPTDARSRLNRRHQNDQAYIIDRAIVEHARTQGISVTRPQREEIVAKYASAVPSPAPPAHTRSMATAETTSAQWPIPDVQPSSGAIPRRKWKGVPVGCTLPKGEVAPPETSTDQPSKKKKRTTSCPPADHTPMPSTLWTRRVPESGERLALSLQDMKNREWSAINELREKLLAAHKRLAELDCQQLVAFAEAARPPPSSSSSSAASTPLPGAKGRKRR